MTTNNRTVWSGADDSLIFALDQDVEPGEIIALRTAVGWESANAGSWARSLAQSLCVATARDEDSYELVGICFLAGNSRHALLVDLNVHPRVQKRGIARRLLGECLSYSHSKGISFLGLRRDHKIPWLKKAYESMGFYEVDFAMFCTPDLTNVPESFVVADLLIRVDDKVEPAEVMALRASTGADFVSEDTWRRCIAQSLCVVTARQPGSLELAAISFLVGNPSHAQLVDMMLAPAILNTRSETSIVASIAQSLQRKLLVYAIEHEIPGVSANRVSQLPWLGDMYESMGFQNDPNMMWHKSSLELEGHL